MDIWRFYSGHTDQQLQVEKAGSLGIRTLEKLYDIVQITVGAEINICVRYVVRWQSQ